MARTNEPTRAFQKRTATAANHVFSITIEIGASDTGAAPHANIVSAVHALAATAPVHKQIIIAAALIQAGTFGRVAEKVQAVVFDFGDGRVREAFAGGGIQLHHKNAVRIGTE